MFLEIIELMSERWFPSSVSAAFLVSEPPPYAARVKCPQRLLARNVRMKTEITGFRVYLLPSKQKR